MPDFKLMVYLGIISIALTSSWLTFVALKLFGVIAVSWYVIMIPVYLFLMIGMVIWLSHLMED